MSHPVGCPLRRRIEVEFVEADVEMGFSLLDLAKAESDEGNPAFAARAVANARDVVLDIEQRLLHLEAAARTPFSGLVAELRSQIECAGARFRIGAES